MDCLNNRSSSYAKFYSRADDCVIRIYDEAGNVIATREQAIQRMLRSFSITQGWAS
jgi:hypothetical protein